MNPSQAKAAPLPRHPVWLANLVNRLITHPVAILHGNVRDLYIEDKQTIHRDLTALLTRIGVLLGQQGIPLSEILFYDGSGTERRAPLAPGGSGDRARRPIPSASAGSGPATDAATGGTRSTGPPGRAMAGWLNDLTEPERGRLAVVYYLDKVIPYGTSYAEGDRTLLTWLEKIIDKITPNHRLVLVALQDTLIPIELYTRAPSVVLQAIPLPDAEEREAYLRHRLGDLQTSGRLDSERFGLLGNLTDGLYLRELDQLGQAIRAASDLTKPSLRRLLNHYRFGEQKDYFGQLDIARIDKAVDWFEGSQKVRGQTEAIKKVRQVLTIARAGLTGLASGTASKPKGVLFFAGPTGVGKTLVAKKLALFLFDDENAFLRFDMSEFNEEHTVSKFIGSPPGYVGFEQGGLLTSGVRERPFSVVLFDEIEKAHPKIMDIFLQILDEGRLTDSRGQTVFFTETIIVFTSNIGTRDEERKRLDQLRADRGLDEAARRQAIADHFVRCVEEFFRGRIARPELLNRFQGNIVPFSFIDDGAIQEQIVSDALARVKTGVEERYRAVNHKVSFAPDLAKWLVRRHSRNLAELGARGIVNRLEPEIVLPLAESLIRAEHRGRTGIEFVVKAPVEGDLAEVTARLDT